MKPNMTLNGIDVASYQSGINLTNVPGDFVFIKFSEGTNYVNPAAIAQYNSAKKAGKVIGLYHYVKGYNYKDEVNHFLATIKPYMKNCIIALDYESPVSTIHGAAYGENALDYLNSKISTTPFLYTGLNEENVLGWNGSVTKYPLWIAQYNSMNTVYGYSPKDLYGSLKHWNKYAVHQYSPAGRLNGYSGDLDLNVAYMSKDELLKLAGLKGGKSTNKSENKENIELSWGVKVKYNDIGGFLVTKKKGATVWAGPNNDKKVKMLKYKTSWRVLKEQDGFYKVGKNQWVDGRTGVFKSNPLAYKNIHAVCEVTGKAKGHAEANGPVTGKKFNIGDRYKVSSVKDGYLRIGAGNNKYINGDKVKIIL